MSYANGTNQDRQPQPTPQPAEPTILRRGDGDSTIWPQGGTK